MKRYTILTSFLFASIILLSNNLYAAQDSTIPFTAKTGWQEVYQQIKRDYSIPTLFKAYPEKQIDINDTMLCKDTLYLPDGMLDRYWNGKAYKWIYECRVLELHADSIFKLTVHFEIMKPPLIVKQIIFKPLTKYADTVGIAEGTWFDSDSIYKLPSLTSWKYQPLVYLERGFPSLPLYTGKEVQWNLLTMGSIYPEGWLCLHAETGKVLEMGVVSVSEPSKTELNSIKITPNPVSNSFSIIGIDNILSVRIMNTLGIEVKQLQLVNGQANVDVSDIAPGVYFMQIRTASGMMTTSMVVCR